MPFELNHASNRASFKANHPTATDKHPGFQKYRRRNAVDLSNSGFGFLVADIPSPNQRSRRTEYRMNSKDLNMAASVEDLRPPHNSRMKNSLDLNRAASIKRAFLDVEYILQNPTIEVMSYFENVKFYLRSLENRFLRGRELGGRSVFAPQYLPSSLITRMANSRFGRHLISFGAYAWPSHASYLSYLFENDPVFLKNIHSRVILRLTVINPFRMSELPPLYLDMDHFWTNGFSIFDCGTFHDEDIKYNHRYWFHVILPYLNSEIIGKILEKWPLQGTGATSPARFVTLGNRNLESSAAQENEIEVWKMQQARLCSFLRAYYEARRQMHPTREENVKDFSERTEVEVVEVGIGKSSPSNERKSFEKQFKGVASITAWKNSYAAGLKKSWRRCPKTLIANWRSLNRLKLQSLSPFQQQYYTSPFWIPSNFVRIEHGREALRLKRAVHQKYRGSPGRQPSSTKMQSFCADIVLRVTSKKALDDSSNNPAHTQRNQQPAPSDEHELPGKMFLRLTWEDRVLVGNFGLVDRFLPAGLIFCKQWLVQEFLRNDSYADVYRVVEACPSPQAGPKLELEAHIFLNLCHENSGMYARRRTMRMRKSGNCVKSFWNNNRNILIMNVPEQLPCFLLRKTEEEFPSLVSQDAWVKEAKFWRRCRKVKRTYAAVVRECCRNDESEKSSEPSQRQEISTEKGDARDMGQFQKSHERETEKRRARRKKQRRFKKDMELAEWFG